MSRTRFLRRPDRVLTILGLGLVGSLLLAAPARPASDGDMRGPLDGKTFSGEAGHAGEEGHPDDFVFTAGTFRSIGCDPYGFTAAAYEAMREGNVIRFKAVTKSPIDGTITWMGKAEGKGIEGTAMWRPKGRKSVALWFRGRLVSDARCTRRHCDDLGLGCCDAP